jgi:hypothetical protein
MLAIFPVENEARFISTNIQADTTPEYNPDAVYVTGNEVRVPQTHTIYKCLIDEMVDEKDATIKHQIKGYYPPDYLASIKSTYPWMMVRADNQWAALDIYFDTKSKNTGSIIYNFNASGCDSAALLNFSAVNVRASLIDGLGEIVWSTEIATYKYVDTLYDFFFSPPEFKQNVFFKFPVGVNTILHIEVINTFSYAELSVFRMGTMYHLGETKTEVQVAFKDFSQYNTDEIGRTTLVPGKCSDIHKFSVNTAKVSFSEVNALVKSIRAKLVVWIVENVDDPNDAEPALITMGWPTDFGQYRRNGQDTYDISIGGSV